MKLIVIESPYSTNPDGSRADAETIQRNLKYLWACIRDCISKGEAPYASHGYLPFALNDGLPAERIQGMEAGFAWGRKADLVVAYIDLGVTNGMVVGFERAKGNGIPVENRKLNGEWLLQDHRMARLALPSDRPCMDCGQLLERHINGRCPPKVAR